MISGLKSPSLGDVREALGALDRAYEAMIELPDFAYGAQSIIDLLDAIEREQDRLYEKLRALEQAAMSKTS